ncbi:MAG: fuculose phosphate aldolase [Clostridiales bacterium 43-6]|nr:MAG: fuculose phosphate aldolase [Clostridiales bacterium 43-6]
MKEYYEIKKQICEVGLRLWQLGFVAANDGNITVKVDADVFLTTPTGVSKSFLTPEMIIAVNSEGKVLDDVTKYKPSSELPMHIRCYREREDIRAVIHAHPPVATGFAIAHIPLDSYTMPEAIIFLGSVPIAKYGTPSTNEIPDAVAEHLPLHDTMLLENHGALTVGVDLMTAYYRMETLEHFAKITLTARQLGGEIELSDKQIADCLQLREKFNVPGKHPGYKKYTSQT